MQPPRLRGRYFRILYFFAGVIARFMLWELVIARLGLRKWTRRTRPERLRREAIRFRAKHIYFFSQIAPQLAMAIENTRLFNKIKEAEKKYRDIIESSPDIIFECTTAGKFLLMSSAVEKITGYPADQFYHNERYGLSLCHSDDQERVQNEILSAISRVTWYFTGSRISGDS